MKEDFIINRRFTNGWMKITAYKARNKRKVFFARGTPRAKNTFLNLIIRDGDPS